MTKKVISWGVTIITALVVTGFIATHGLSGTLHAWLHAGAAVYHWLVDQTPVVTGPVKPLNPHYHPPTV